MKKFLTMFLIAVAMLTGSPNLAMEGLPNYYVAAFTSPEFTSQWEDEFKPDMKYIYHSWGDLPDFIDKAKKEAGTRPLLLDLDVHGAESGFYVLTNQFYIYKGTKARFKFKDLSKQMIVRNYERASMGYIYNVLDKKIGPLSRTTVLIEACFPGNAYHTINNNDLNTNERYVQNHSQYPMMPIYCIGSGFSNPDITMMFQFKHNIRRFWHDIREYGARPPFFPELEVYGFEGTGVSYSTLRLMQFSDFIRQES